MLKMESEVKRMEEIISVEYGDLPCDFAQSKVKIA